MEFDKIIHVRCNKETKEKIKKIIKKNKELYSDESQVVRSAIWYLFNKEVNNNE